MEERSLNHFTLLQFTETYWGLPVSQRRDVHQRFWGRVREAADRAYLYQVFPARADGDLLLWCAVRVLEPERPGRFFADLGTVLSNVRPYLRSVQTLWGFTKPSVYARGQSPQEMDPFGESRRAYLVVYPFVKTAEWYLLSKDTRQGMMNEHIRVGRQYPAILQLLLYSFGVQDQEFVVVYEMDDLMEFSDLVQDLRATEVRRYTERDTPIITALYRPAEETLRLFE
ncbi:MAG: chlorite dismutase family protein [Acidobacteria bacterium]|nr:chlorite dismutase family protein [Acidobacteriota bacterium]MDW7983311.1 chlorite dismutase family protein [Acidobacteriota bacterium]